ncbi:MAG: ABC transporter ATP-binding protein [Magnetovibrionaceae bacterium]
MPEVSSPAASSPPPGIQLSGGRLAFEGDVLFDNLKLTLPAGLFTVLLGPSGIGKSALLRLLAGLQDQAEADIRCSDDAPLAQRVAYMAQDDLLLPWLSARDNVCLGARLRGTVAQADRARAQDLLHAVGLGNDADKSIAALSGGMRQRVALARTLFEDRAVVLMDEPFSALDAVTRLRLQDLAAELLEGRTVLLVTHDPLEALRIGHRVHVMSGRPATLDDALVPEGNTPRAVGDSAITTLEAQLLNRLQAAAS